MIIAVTPGDPEGVGPEIVWKTLRSQPSSGSRRQAHLLCIGAREPFERLGAPIVEARLDQLLHGFRPTSSRKPFVWLLPAPESAPRKPGCRPLFLPGFQSGWAIVTATALAQRGVVSAIATGPISKERLQAGGYPFPGHTEFLAHLCGRSEVTMMLANDQLRVALVTTHLALSEVPGALRRSAIRRTVLHAASHLRAWWGISRPRIAIAALNPHAGEGGLFGREEIRVITPEVQALRRRASGRFEISGPYPADTLFAKHLLARPKDRFDAVVCMYHDQGLIPVKLLDFPRTVNVTLGLPIVRTSVDHGVGFDIAGQGTADPSSLQAAIELAIRIAHKRKRISESEAP